MECGVEATITTSTSRQHCSFAGCTGTVCGVKVSSGLSDFLNFPNLNLLVCGLLSDCTNTAYTAGVTGGQVWINLMLQGFRVLSQ